MVFCSEYNILGLLLLVYKFLFNWKLSIFTICDDSKEIAESASLVKRCMRFIAVKFYSGIILTNDDVLSWYVKHFQAKRKFLFSRLSKKIKILGCYWRMRCLFLGCWRIRII